MFSKLRDYFIQEPTMLAVSVFVTLFAFGALRHQLTPYYDALIEYTGGGTPAIIEMYESISLAIILALQ
ncbi:hypothetical protein [Vibrio diazotrophicus]|uniref:hypothetical protein n=1 Tax=Vibrio diazotrophicus TaxID=685 RepID=UPI003D2F6D4B